MSSNVLKGFNISYDEEKGRVIDSKTRMERRLHEIEEEKLLRMEEFSEDVEESEDGFTPLEVEQVGALFDEEGEEAIRKVNEKKDAKIAEELRKEAEELLANAQNEADAILEDARIKADALMQEARANGGELGYQDGIERANRELEEARGALEAEAMELEQFYQSQIDALEPKFVDTITSVYETVFGMGLLDIKAIVSNLVKKTLGRAEASSSYLVHVSREDYEAVCARKPEMAEAVPNPQALVEIIEDVTLKEGSAFIETEDGIYDCSVDVELEELRNKLMLLASMPVQ